MSCENDEHTHNRLRQFAVDYRKSHSLQRKIMQLLLYFAVWTEPNPTHRIPQKIRPNPTYGWTQPMAISGLHYLVPVNMLSIIVLYCLWYDWCAIKLFCSVLHSVMYLELYFHPTTKLLNIAQYKKGRTEASNFLSSMFSRYNFNFLYNKGEDAGRQWTFPGCHGTNFWCTTEMVAMLPVVVLAARPPGV